MDTVNVTSSPMNLKQASEYLQVSHHTLYKWTSKGLLPFYKPNGRMLYFRKDELDGWVFRNRNIPAYELDLDRTSETRKPGGAK